MIREFTVFNLIVVLGEDALVTVLGEAYYIYCDSGDRGSSL